MPSVKKNEINKNHPNLAARILPHNLEAEQAVLGCVLIDEYAPLHILNELKPDDFYSPAHTKIFEAMLEIMHKDKPVDIVMLVQELETMGETENAGGLTYLTTLSNIVPSASNYAHYTDIVKKNSMLRRLIASAQKITDKAFTGDPDDDALKFAEGEIYTLAEKLDKSSLAEAREAVKAAIDKMEFLFNNPNALRGIPTGFKRLNDLLNGLQPSDLILIAARPGQGKTSIGMNIIQHAALDNNRRTEAGKPDPYKCAVFSLEMPAVQLARRMLCSVSKVSLRNASKGDLKPDEWKRLHAGKALLDRAHIYIDDSSLTTPIEILSKCRRLKREKGLDLIMVDYLQLMSSGKKVENRQQEVADITRTMKIAAKELNVPILLLSQMSREVEKRQTKRPQMSDLRESGAIEQDADIIMFIYREHDPHDLSIDEATRNKVELVIAKHRNGETGDIELKWRGEWVSFEDVDSSAALESRVPPAKDEGGSFVMADDSAPAQVSSMTTEEILSVRPESGNDDDIF